MRALVALTGLLIAVPASAQQPDQASLNTIFASMAGSQNPGCAVAVARNGSPFLSGAYGSADLEHGVQITPATIFEAGSVSKQFTAAAILLLAEEGKLQLSDDVRRYVPELPDYAAKITIDHLLSHTSGLRDWGSVMDIAGWPRGTRAYTMADVLAIIQRQRELNHAPGAEYSYTNSGYNLLAMIVHRVSGSSLADFTKARLFQPLGMNSTSWRDDFRRVVPGRAIAYDRRGDRFAQDMPFEDAYGNGGLLTTVHDLLAWNEALTTDRLGARVTRLLAERATLNDRRSIAYARGLFVQQYSGQQEIAHGGATGGYRTWLGRYPQERLSIALLCNSGAAASTSLGQKVADLFLTATPAAGDVRGTAASTIQVDPALPGDFVNERDGTPLQLRIEEGKLRATGRPPFETISARRFRHGPAEVRFVGTDRYALQLPDGELVNYRRVKPFTPTITQLEGFAGRYTSEEVGATYTLARKGDGLVMRLEGRPEMEMELKPAYADAFATEGGIVRFRRNSKGTVTGFGVGIPRVRDILFKRIDPSRTPASLSRMSASKASGRS